jgi:hypothetical protein
MAQNSAYLVSGQRGLIFDVKPNGDLLWYNYLGHGEDRSSAATAWQPNSGNAIGNGWQGNLHVFGAEQNVIYVVRPNGDLAWYQYLGNGENDRSGDTGWHPNSGNLIGNGWQGNLNVFGGVKGEIYVVRPNGDLAWYQYGGSGENDPSGQTGWNPNSGNLIENGWQGNLNVFVGGGGAIFVVKPNGDLAWYRYLGNGENDGSGATGWDPNSGNLIGNGWQGNLHVIGNQDGTIFVVNSNGDLIFHEYHGDGASDPTGAEGWNPNSGNPIGRDW